MLDVFKKSTVIDKSVICEKNEKFNIIFNQDKVCFDHLDHKLQNIINKLDNLKAVMDQIGREKTCLTNKLLNA